MKISKTKLKDTLEWLFAFFGLQLSTGAIITAVKTASVTDEYAALSPESDPVLRAIWFLVYGISACLLCLRWKQFIRVTKRDIFLVLLVGIAIASIFWSASPEFTLRRSGLLLGTTLFGVYIATRYTTSEIMQLIVWTLSIGAVLSVMFAIALPQYGVMPDSGAWRGIYTHKNFLGRLMGLNAVFLLLLNPQKQTSRWAVRFAIALSIGLVAMSTSKGALVFLVILLTLMPLYRSLRWKYTIAIPFAVSFVVVLGSLLTLLLENLEYIVVDKLGKDLTFTGRTYIWESVIGMIQQRPLLGYGYTAFWQGLEGPSVAVVSAVDWAVPHSHNGYLDLCLDLGIVGLTLFVLGLGINLVRTFTQLHLTKTPAEIWPLIFLTGMVVYNFVESAILKQNSFFWITYVMAALTRPNQQH